MNELKRTLPFISILAFASMALTRVCDPMLTTLSKEFEVSFQDGSRVIAWYAVAYGIMQLIYGPLSGKLGKMRIITSASYGCALLSVVAALATNFSLLVGVRVLLGAAAAAIIPLSMAWIGDHVAYSDRQSTLARLMVATVSGLMAGQALGGFAAGYLNWRWAFIFLAALFMLGAYFLSRRSRSDRDSVREQAVTTSSISSHVIYSLKLLNQSHVRWVLLVVGLEGFLVFGPLSLGPTLLVEHFGYPVGIAGVAMMLYGVGGLGYAVFAKRWLRVLGEKGLAITGGLLLGLAFYCLAVSEFPALANLACIFGGLGFYMLHNTLQTQATQMAPEARGAAVALFASVLFIGQSFGISASVSLLHWTSIADVFIIAAIMLPGLGYVVSRGLSPCD